MLACNASFVLSIQFWLRDTADNNSCCVHNSSSRGTNWLFMAWVLSAPMVSPTHFPAHSFPLISEVNCRIWCHPVSSIPELLSEGSLCMLGIFAVRIAGCGSRLHVTGLTASCVFPSIAHQPQICFDLSPTQDRSELSGVPIQIMSECGWSKFSACQVCNGGQLLVWCL